MICFPAGNKMRKQFPQIFPKTLNQSFEKCETPFITIHTFSLGAAVTGCLENKYFNLVSLGFYIGKQKDLFVQASIILPTRATLPFYDHTKMKRKKEKKTSQHPHHFFSAISRIQSRPGARVHFMKLNPSPVHFKQGHTHTHTKKARAVRLCSVKEALMLMEHNRGGKGLFGCKEMQRTWHV